MARSRNSDSDGKPFGDTTVRTIWQKGRVILGWDPTMWRQDMCGKRIRFDEYGNTASKHGWEIGHIKLVAKGGTDESSNLQPLQWENNRDKSDTYPWSCP